MRIRDWCITTAVARKGLPEGMCGSIVYSGLEAEGPAQLAAAGHMKALEDVRVAVLRSVAAELVDHVWGQPKPEDFGKALPDVEALLTSAGAAEKYGNTLDAALELAADTEQKQLAEQVKNDARRGSWLSAAGFFNTIAYRVGRFHAGVNSVPEVSAPLPELKERWVPQAYWAWKAVTDALANSQEYPAVVASGALSGAGSVLSAGGSQRFIGAVLASIGIKDIAIQQTGNPVADLANFGHSLINRALYAMGALARSGGGIGDLRRGEFGRVHIRVAGSGTDFSRPYSA